MLPVVSAAASWVDSLKLPMREIRQKYTKSDMVIMSWDSRQKSYNMSKGFKKGPQDTATRSEANPLGVREIDNAYILPDGVNNGVAMQKKWFNEEGMLDLRLATGPEACAYLNALGVKIMPVISM